MGNKLICKYCGYGGEPQDKDYPDWKVKDGVNSICGECDDLDMILERKE